MRILLSLLFVILIGHTSYSQNSKRFFRAVPSSSEIEAAPKWAQLMYSDNPDVSQVIDAYEAYYRQNDFEKTIHTQNYKYWIKKVEPLLDDNATIHIPTLQEEAQYFKQLKAKKKKTNTKSMDMWSSIGPFETYKNNTQTPISHHSNVYSITQSLNDPNLLICGTESGGVFKTIDKGQTWTLISKDEPFSNGITAVAIDPTDDDVFYVSGNNRIYKSTDGGSTWTENYGLGGSAYEIKFDPDDPTHIFMATNQGLFESTDNALTWSQILTETVWDIDWHPTDHDTVYILKSNPTEKKTEFFRSLNSGMTWTLISTGWYVPEVPAEANENGGKIGVSADAPDRVYACLIGQSKNGDNGWIGIYRSDNSGTSWYLPSGQIGGPYAAINTMPWNAAAYGSGYHQGFYNFDFEVSPADADLMWFGTIRLSESSDGGFSYVSIGAANSTRLTDVHADIQSIHVQGSDIWVASDGGINYSNDNLMSHSSLKYGINALDFWGFGTGWNEDVLVGGKYHNGNTVYYDNYGIGNSHNVGGVEEATGYVNRLVNKNVYFNQYWSGYTVSKIISDTLYGNAVNINPVNLLPNESYLTSYSSGFYHHPIYPGKMIAGKDSIIWASNDGGSNWSVMHEFGTGRVLEMEYARSNPDVIYCVFKPTDSYWEWCKIYKTIDGGQNWTLLPDVPSNNRWRLEISVNPIDENEIWVATVNGGNGQKIYKSENGGQSWTNMTTSSFDGDNIRDIAYHAGSDELVYALTNQSFYYYDKPGGAWIQYDSGLPMIQNSGFLRLFYRDSKLRMCSKGRGFWEADMPMVFDPIALPMTKSDTVQCERDSVVLDCHSVLNHNNASWLWTITPAPQYISNNQDRNPKVVFGSAGYYDVELAVTDDNNVTDTRSIPQMIYVEPACTADTIQGKSIALADQGDWVQLPDFDVSTSTFSISAWIKPSQIQDNYASIVMNDGVAAGLNFRESNNTLGYHWSNGGSWGWDSNLVAPVDEWSHVAMVVDPTGVSIFLNGQKARHNTAISPIDMTTFKIGSYKGWGGRNYKGEIDEVSIWSKALTDDEVRLLRHLTLEDHISDPDFLSYYQFNNATPQIQDKAGLNHGITNGNVVFNDCYAAFGGGESDIQLVNTGGNYVFGSTGIELNFPATGSLPNGQLVATRINLLPYPALFNNENLGSYFIINNYGDNGFTDVYDIKYDDPYSSPSSDAVANPSSVRLIRRPANSYMSDWNVLCNMNSVAGEFYSFANNANCQNAEFGQYFLNLCLPSSIENMDYQNGETKEVRVSQFIEAYNTIFSGANVLYSSEGSIDLLPEFEVKTGGLFEANNSGCTNN